MKRIGTHRTAVKVALSLVLVVVLMLTLSQSVFAAKTWCDEDNSAVSATGTANMSAQAAENMLTVFPGKDGKGIPSNAVSSDRDGLGGTNTHK